MSLYCKGNGCPVKGTCVRYLRGKEYVRQYGSMDNVEGLWLVNETDCANNHWRDGVFIKIV